MQFRMLPEYLIENVVEYLDFLFRWVSREKGDDVLAKHSDITQKCSRILTKTF
jgi:hypothetical protein